MKWLIFIKWITTGLLIFICALWLSYFFDCLNKSEYHFFSENNYALNFIQWFKEISNRIFVFRFRFFDDNFYLDYFPGVILLAEILFVISLLVSIKLQKQKRKQYGLNFVSAYCVLLCCLIS